MDAENTNLNYVSGVLFQIEPGKLAAIESVCARFDLDQKTVGRLQFTAERIGYFELVGKQKVKTPRQRAKDFDRVKALCVELDQALLDMDDWDAEYLVRRVFPASPGDPYEYHRLHGFSLQIKQLSLFAQHEFSEIGEKGITGGRSPTLQIYADYVGEIWEHIKGAGINPGRGGPFEDVCNVVFDAAKVHSSPAGAIREFLRDFENNSN